MSRAVALPIDPANIAQLDARDHRIFYLTQPLALIAGPLKGEKSALHFYDLKARKDQVVSEDVDAYSLSLDGKKVLIRHDADYTVLDAKPDAAKDDDSKQALDLGHMRTLVDPKAEWAEMFDNAWRLERDLFFSPVMNGQNWTAIGDSYRRLLPLAGSREDLNNLIGQMIGELSNSHYLLCRRRRTMDDPTPTRSTPRCSASTGRSIQPPAATASPPSIPATTPATTIAARSPSPAWR